MRKNIFSTFETVFVLGKAQKRFKKHFETFI